MKRGLNRLFPWAAFAGVLVWGAFFYHAYTNLAIPAFGPPEQGVIALRDLFIRYGLYLAVPVGAWAGLRRLIKKRVKAVARIKVRSLG